ncbi:torsin-1A isoform X2 [Adelges cooleyi]|uniref:torsin-1A isoform X2 n=1 Tax=Adelges cooleyi TaxID=133065 RepID=UPI00217FED0B|nr:torsin-1A isoform X2 [Adelges cooleyi]
MVYIKKYTVLLLCYFLLFDITQSLIDPVTVSLAGVAFLGGYLYKNYNSKIFQNHKCCENIDFDGLEDDMNKLFFGQHIASKIILSTLKGNFRRSKSNKKPLVMSLHGCTGVGKNYITNLIANHIFVTEHSKKVQFHIINGRSEFPDSSKIGEYKVKLLEKIYEAIKTCRTNLFVFDEITSVPRGILDVLIPILENNISALDSRHSIFIFLTNTGEHAIIKQYLNLWKNGFTRDLMEVKHFDYILQTAVFNEPSGLRQSDIIDSHVIDHFVPFLPLEKSHVVQCIESELRMLKQEITEEIIEKTLEIITFGPEPERLFSNAGCKRISQKVLQLVYDY